MRPIKALRFALISTLVLATHFCGKAISETRKVIRNDSTRTIVYIKDSDWKMIDYDDNDRLYIGQLIREEISKQGQFHVKVFHVKVIANSLIDTTGAMFADCKNKSIGVFPAGQLIPVVAGTMQEAMYEAFCD